MGRSPYLCVVAAALACRVLSAQHSHAQTSQSGSPMQLTVVVDGSKTPSQIPDNLAYHHFFLRQFPRIHLRPLKAWGGRALSFCR
jgi:hypothetical protein